MFHKGDYYIGDPLFLCHYVDRNFENYQPQYGDYTNEEFIDLIDTEYKEYLKCIRVANTLGIMKRGIRDKLKTYRSVSVGKGSFQVFDGYRQAEQGLDIPYGFDNEILRDNKTLPSNRPTQNMEWIQHYENYHNTMLSTKFYPYKDSEGYNKRVFSIECNAKDFMKDFKITVHEKEDIDPRQLTFLLSRISHPKEWIKSVFVKPSRRNPNYFDFATTNRYDKFLSKQQLEFVSELRKTKTDIDWNPFDPYRRIPMTESDMRYTFVVQRNKPWVDPIRKKVQSIKGYALKVFPPYTGYSQYDFRTDSFIVDLDEFMNYYKLHKLYEIDMSFFPFTDKMPVMSGDSIEMIVPKKGYEQVVLDEYFPEIYETDFHKIENDKKFIDKWTETVDSVNVLKYEDDLLTTTDWYVIKDSTPLKISLKGYKNINSNLSKMVKDYFTSIGLSMEKSKES